MDVLTELDVKKKSNGGGGKSHFDIRQVTIEDLEVPGIVLQELEYMTEIGKQLLYVPTSGVVRPGDPDALYISTQAGLVLRFDVVQQRFDTKPIWDFRQTVIDMRSAASQWPAQKFRHLRFPDDFIHGMKLSDERGLLGLAFHPKHPERMYVQISTASREEQYDHYAMVWCVNLDTKNVHDVLELPQPQFNHNGGDLCFGPHDGMLYLSFGDGGGFNDEHGKTLKDSAKVHFGHAQDPTVLYGKILRIDVNRDGGGYSIPHHNPLRGTKLSDWPADRRKYFAKHRLRNEIWAMGLRNVWKFSFWQRGNRTCMALADVGQSKAEEVNMIRDVAAFRYHPRNYGWRAYEGPHIFSSDLANLLIDSQQQKEEEEPPRLVTNAEAIESALELNLDLEVLPGGLNIWRQAVQVETEHGLHDLQTNVTDDDPLATAKIALAHIKEDRLYYERLQRMEENFTADQRYAVLAPNLWYPRTDGVAVIGGYVYPQGSAVRAEIAAQILRQFGVVPDDIYVFGDYHGRVFVAWNQTSSHVVKANHWTMRELFRLPQHKDIHGFAQDAKGNIYVLWTQTFHEIAESSRKESGISLIRLTASDSKLISSGAGFMDMQRGISKDKTVKGYLDNKTMHGIGQLALKRAFSVKDPLRRDPRTGKRVPAKMQVVVLSRPLDAETDPALWPRHYMRSETVDDVYGNGNDDAWQGSFDIARAKAYSALAFSSNQNALTTRSLGELSQPGKSLYGLSKTNLGTSGPPGSGVKRRGLGVVTFPGGIPLYDTNGTRLVGAIGVSGSAVDTDEAVAMAGAAKWPPSHFIRIDVVTSGEIQYTAAKNG